MCTTNKLIEGTKFARQCDECGSGMNEGFVVNDGDEYFCSDKCLHEKYSKKDWKRMYGSGDSDSYWTDWNDDQSDWQYIVTGGVLVDMDDLPKAQESPVADETNLSPAQLLERALAKMDDMTVGAWDSALEDTSSAVLLEDFKNNGDDHEEVTHVYNGWLEDIQKALEMLKKG